MCGNEVYEYETGVSEKQKPSKTRDPSKNTRRKSEDPSKNISHEHQKNRGTLLTLFLTNLKKSGDLSKNYISCTKKIGEPLRKYISQTLKNRATSHKLYLTNKKSGDPSKIISHEHQKNEETSSKMISTKLGNLSINYISRTKYLRTLQKLYLTNTKKSMDPS